MTLNDHLKAFRRRWLVIAACTVVAAAVMWLVTPAETSTAQKANSYTATATLLVGTDAQSTAQMGRIALYLTTGEIPRRAAKSLGYTGDPAVLASGLTVTPDFTAAALKVAATAPSGDQAAAIANAFANQTVAFFKTSQPGLGAASVTLLQKATPIPNVTGGGFVVPPSRGVRTALAAVLGLLVGLALALVLDRLDSRLRSREEIAAALRMPIIAEVPRMTRAQRAANEIGVAVHPLSPYADAYRAARTAVVHTSSQQLSTDSARRATQPEGDGTLAKARLVLVTSANAAEGKTTSVANLAASFAETGQRVLVLDADLRSPDTHVLFDVPQGAGISDYLSRPDDSSLEALIRPTSIPDVRIITAGTRLTHPASLASRMGGLLRESRDLADVVLIDTAPLLAASDVFDLLPLVDTVVIVVRHGRLTEAAGNRVAELLGRFQVPVSGVVVVGAQTKRSGAYGYGYGYGYGEQKKKAKHSTRGREGATVSEEHVNGAAAESRRGRRTSRSV